MQSERVRYISYCQAVDATKCIKVGNFFSMNNRDGESGGIQEVLRVKTGINPEESQKKSENGYEKSLKNRN